MAWKCHAGKMDAKKLQKRFGNALSPLIYIYIYIFFFFFFFWGGGGVIAQEALKTLKWPSSCAHLLVYIRYHPRN